MTMAVFHQLRQQVEGRDPEPGRRRIHPLAFEGFERRVGDA
jgi:hypothetical protein